MIAFYRLLNIYTRESLSLSICSSCICFYFSFSRLAGCLKQAKKHAEMQVAARDERAVELAEARIEAETKLLLMGPKAAKDASSNGRGDSSVHSDDRSDIG